MMHFKLIQFFIGVKTDLFIKNQEHTPVKDDITKSFDALQVTK